jgi:hypothetical protein
MADAPPANRRPRWYQDLRWILAGLVLVVVATPLYGLFGPDAPIVVSPATTVITEPLAADGLPDYAAHVLARAGRGTPPDDNAAVPLLMALWPLKFDEADLPAVCQELGIDVPSPPPDAFQADDLSRDTGIRAAIEGILADRVPAEATSITPFDVIDAARNHPWRAADLPALDAWLAAHAGRLDLLRETSRRPRLYLPNPTLLRGNRDSVLSSGLHLGRPLRQAVTVLQLRAMGHLGHGRPAEAWRDILAMHRLARLASAADGGSVLGRLIAVVFSGAACAATLQLLDAPGLPTDPFCGGPFVYERRGAGYLLSSIGQNGRDDGGTDYSAPIVAGEWAKESPHLGDAKTTDVVVRLPLPGSPILERLRVRP